MQSCHKTYVNQVLFDGAKYKSSIVILQTFSENLFLFVCTHCEIIDDTKKLSDVVRAICIYWHLGTILQRSVLLDCTQAKCWMNYIAECKWPNIKEYLWL